MASQYSTLQAVSRADWPVPVPGETKLTISDSLALKPCCNVQAGIVDFVSPGTDEDR
jgi:hypothetical protein